MEVEYIIVQAGGRGSRLGVFTANMPKALVPVKNRPILFHLFEKYPDKRFIIIGDYKFDVLRRYLAAFAEAEYLLINAGGKKGTCAGIKKALEKIPESTPFALIWSDLVLGDGEVFPNEAGNYIGLSESFRCRWSFREGKLVEESSVKDGVAGLFLFKEKKEIINVPEEGEFVRWLKQSGLFFSGLPLGGTEEFGIQQTMESAGKQICRPFNRIRFEKDIVVKEMAWYRHVKSLGYRYVPEIYKYSPLVMERIGGKNLYQYGGLLKEEKREILSKVIKELKHLHNLQTAAVDPFSMEKIYVRKTFQRIEKVRGLIPFADRRIITVNGKKCRNVFLFRSELEDMLEERLTAKQFCLIHGDCTFSNLMIREERQEAVLIDPRGYFGYSKFVGDPDYDWAKLYYSIVGNYDRFNRREFILTYGEDDVTLQIDSNQWEDMEEIFFEMLGKDVDPDKIKLIHALIWLSLTAYAWEDYDSVCGAFYNGLFYLEDMW